MKFKGSEIIIETLAEQGCDTVFGYPGGSVLEIYDELYKNSDRIHHVISAHEQGATHAADGYARVSGKPGVVIATSGPGATNTVTGIANAYLDSSPMVVITGNVAVGLLGRDSFQEVDIMGITMPITKHNYIVRETAALAPTIREAFSIALSDRQGPVLIDVPKDVQIGSCEYTHQKAVKRGSYKTPDEESLNEAVKLMSEAERPYIYCGGGVVASGAGGDIVTFSKKIGAPIGCSIMGLTAVPYSYEYNLGVTGMHGKYASSKAKSESDLIIAVGVRFSDRATGNKDEYVKGKKVIHIDIDPAEIGKNIPAFVGLVGNIADTLKTLNGMLKPKKHSEWLSHMKELKQDEIEDNGAFSPRLIINKVRDFTDDDTVIATDVGQHQMWVMQNYRFEKPRRLITSGGLGTMGFGMGAAIGACFANGRRRTVLFTGDGSFGMNLNELATAVSNNLPLTVIVMNNNSLGMVRQWQTLFYERRYSSTTLNRKTDFVKLAEAFGALGFSAHDEDSLHKALYKSFNLGGVSLIDCHIDPDERVLPMIPPGGSINDIIVR